jgi:hypothetical protein
MITLLFFGYCLIFFKFIFPEKHNKKIKLSRFYNVSISGLQTEKPKKDLKSSYC